MTRFINQNFFVLCFVLISCLDKQNLIKQDIRLTDLHSYWFESEQTVFAFYTIENRHGFSPDALLQITLDPFADEVVWQNVEEVANVHRHEDALCNEDSWCKSLSIKTDKAPRALQLRYLYHKDGSLSEIYQSEPIVMEQLYPEAKDSLMVFGVFDEGNRYTHWRGWHNFPGLRQEKVKSYGLRRDFSTKSAFIGVESIDVKINNPSLYGVVENCDELESYTEEEGTSINTSPYWLLTPLPEGYESTPWVCTMATVATGVGTTTKAAVGRKNPEFTSVPERLNLEFKETNVVQLLFAACETDNKDQDYLDFQLDRLVFNSENEDLCVDSADFTRSRLTRMFEAKILQARARGDQDVSLVMIVHHTNEDAKEAIQEELEAALIVTASNASLGLKGVFVYDSYGKESLAAELLAVGAWCPTLLGGIDTLDSCFLAPSSRTLGPFEIRLTPVLPSYDKFQELDEGQIKDIQMKSLKFYAPQATNGALYQKISLEPLFFSYYDPLDVITVGSNQRLSYCPTGDEALALAYSTTPEVSPPSFGPLAGLPGYHMSRNSQQDYLLGVNLTYPFLLQLEYKSSVRVGPKNLVSYVAIKRSQNQQDQLGDPRYLLDSVKLGEALKHCTQFCNHPAFNDRSQYNFSISWQDEYATSCYRPAYPQRGG